LLLLMLFYCCCFANILIRTVFISVLSIFVATVVVNFTFTVRH
jgi:hypothetical protein